MEPDLHPDPEPKLPQEPTPAAQELVLALALALEPALEPMLSLELMVALELT